jgi:hypothetical protein
MSSLRSHNDQLNYNTELARLKKEQEERKKDNKKALTDLKYKYIFRKEKKSKTKSKRNN